MAQTTALSTLNVAPEARPGWTAGLLRNPALPAAAARLGAWLATAWGGPIRLGGNVVAARHADVRELLARDLDFRIAPVNAARMEAVNGPFILGMDRGAALARERGALYRALATVDLDGLRDAAVAAAAERLAAAADRLELVNGYARPIAAATASRLFGIGGAEGSAERRAMTEAARDVFAHTFLNLGDDAAVAARALRAATVLRGLLAEEIARRRAADAPGHDLMGALLRDAALDDDAVRRTLGGMLVGSIDTTATSVAQIVATLCRDRALLHRVTADAADPLLLAGWCREALRRWPHNPILLRRAAAATTLGGTAVRAGDRVVAWTQAAMLDAAAFPEPGQLRPDRPAAAYLHLGGGLHPCAGRAVNAFQIPALVGALLRRGLGERIGAIGWAGPFPDRLEVHLLRGVPA